MSSRSTFVFCIQLLVQSIAAQCVGTVGVPLGAAPLTSPCAGVLGTPYAAVEWAYAPASSLTASNAPGVAVSTTSPLVPAGVNVLSNNVFEGNLAVGGALPFLGTVAIEGALPTAGAGAVAYNCGNGAVAITAEDMGAFGIGEMFGPFSYNAGGTSFTPLTTIPMAVAPIAAAPMIPAPLPPLSAAPYSGLWQTPEYIPAASLAASNGPGVAVSTASPILPAGVSVQSENAYEGALAVGGALPFLGTVAFEGALPTAGAGAVAYGCGNGVIGVTAEDFGAIGFTGMAGPFGYGAGFAGPFAYGPIFTGLMAEPGCAYRIV